MNDQLKLIEAELVVLMKRIEELESAVNGGSHIASPQSYLDKLRREARKIVDQIR